MVWKGLGVHLVITIRVWAVLLRVIIRFRVRRESWSVRA